MNFLPLIALLFLPISALANPNQIQFEKDRTEFQKEAASLKKNAQEMRAMAKTQCSAATNDTMTKFHAGLEMLESMTRFVDAYPGQVQSVLNESPDTSGVNATTGADNAVARDLQTKKAIVKLAEATMDDKVAKKLKDGWAYLNGRMVRSMVEGAVADDPVSGCNGPAVKRKYEDSRVRFERLVKLGEELKGYYTKRLAELSNPANGGLAGDMPLTSVMRLSSSGRMPASFGPLLAIYHRK